MALHASLRDRLDLAEHTIRDTPIIALADDAVDLFAKREYCKGIGSIKDRPALWILQKAIDRGDVGPQTTLIESSACNIACALATFATLLELESVQT